MSHLTGLACIRCGASFGIEPRFDGCPECRAQAPANLTPHYDLDAAGRELSFDSLRDRPSGMRRYRELLPPDVQDAPTLGEGETPLLHCERYGRRIGVERLFLKDESQNPSGSFKDRLAFAAMAMAKRFDARAVGVSSTGNAGAAAAAYAARAGLPCIVLTVQGAASAIVTQMQAYGAMVAATRTKADRWTLLQTGVAHWGWYPTSPYFGPPVGSNPYGVDGYKTLAYEVCEQMDWEPPDWCVLPVAYGDALFGMWKGFDELAKLGLVSKRPRMVAAEMAGCLAAALASGQDAIPEIPAPRRTWPAPSASTRAPIRRCARSAPPMGPRCWHGTMSCWACNGTWPRTRASTRNRRPSPPLRQWAACARKGGSAETTRSSW